MQDQPITDETQVSETESTDTEATETAAAETNVQAPVPSLIDRITGAASEFAAGVRKVETAKTEHGQTVTAREQAQVAESEALTGKADATDVGVAAADRLIAVVNEWRTAAISG